jgi:hypothetical protein
VNPSPLPRARSRSYGSAAIRLSLTAAIAAIVGAPVACAAQTSAASDGWEPPRTAWGHPDLQGNWTNATVTPFERPRGQGPVLTPEQVTALEQGRGLDVELVVAASDPNRPPPTAGGTNPVCIDGAMTCYDGVYLDPGERVAMVNGEPRSSLVTRPADGRVPPLTEAGQQRASAFSARFRDFGPSDHPEVRPVSDRCLVSFGSSAGPPMIPNGWYNNNYTIVQNADHVVILAEMVHDARIVRIGEPNPLPDDVRPWFGDSRGYWEGNTLVVETTNIRPEQSFRGAPRSSSHKVIERFTRVDEETILYEFTIDDPATYTEAWGGEIPFRSFDQPVFEYACHEGNYALENILRGARFEERQAAGQ